MTIQILNTETPLKCTFEFFAGTTPVCCKKKAIVSAGHSGALCRSCLTIVLSNGISFKYLDASGKEIERRQLIKALKL